ncbi:MAG TPA: CaiB/BaiF CoA-transferase family protein [Burkholderiaceae bacterium]|jgi:crotonobetainyl-CoA:carnitine CoA-transferase CaiB-like acyl-CoA transferase
MGVLTGLRVVEIAGLGPAPFCGMLLADMGAEVILIERPAPAKAEPMDLGDKAIFNRGKKSIVLDLKDPESVEIALRLIDTADALIEGMRPGVMERLGLGPDFCLARNPRLVYGRMTGWGQDGPLAQSAGHDLNYIALSGALWYASPAGSAPLTPPTLVGDLGGGALYLAMGLLAGILAAKSSGHGQVVDAAIVDGSANLMNLLLSVHAAGLLPMERGQGLLDGPYWYGSYACADGEFITLASMEPQFYALLLQKLKLENDTDFNKRHDKRHWPELRARLEAIFKSQSRQHWVDMLEGSDACFAPVLNPLQAQAHPHMQARQIYSSPGDVLQAAPAPRFSAHAESRPGKIPARGEHTQELLVALGHVAKP